MSTGYNMLIITDYSAPYEGNFIESIKMLNKKYEQDGNKIYYLFPERAKKLDWIINLIDINKFNIYFFKDDSFMDVIKQTKHIVKNKDINALYTHFCRHKTQFAIKMIRFSNSKIKLISHFHNHCKVNGNILKRTFMKFAYKLYEGDLNIGCSKSVKDSMPYKEKKITYVDNGICFSRLEKYQLVDLGRKDSKYIILLFGFDYYRKGVDIAIKAIESLNNPNIVLAISFASNKAKAEEIIKKEHNTIPNFINFLEPRNDIGTYFKNADLFISAAREEGFCYSIVEAAYCKTKILSSNIPGVPMDIPGEYVFEKGNYQDLADKINVAYNDKNNKLEEAYEYVKEKYTVDNWVEKTASEIYKCIR